MKKLLSGMIFICLIILMTVPAWAKGGSMKLAMTSAEAKAGEEVTLTVDLSDNPGIAYLGIPINYDESVLEKVEYTGSGLGEWTIGSTAVWVDTDDSKYNGTILTLKFKVKADAKPGKTNVTIGEAESYNASEEDVAATATSGTVTITCTRHQLTRTAEKEATCAEAGIPEYWTCSVCGKMFSDEAATKEMQEADMIIAATGHSLTRIEAKEATEAKEGNIAYYTCPACGKCFSDAEGKTEIAKEDTVIAKKPAATSKEEPISIKQATITGVENMTYTGKAITQKMTVKLGNATLESGKDYTIAYKNNINAGTATVTVTGIGLYKDSCQKTFTIARKKATPDVTLSAASFVYNGKVRKPSVTVKLGKTTLGKSAYSVAYAKGCKAVGNYTVTVKLLGNYTGSKSVSFQICPKTTTLSKVTSPAKKTLKVTWKKNAVQTTGFLIEYATNAKFKSSKMSTVSKAKATSASLKKLKRGKTYYVRIRAYKQSGTRIFYGDWSKTMKRKVK